MKGEQGADCRVGVEINPKENKLENTDGADIA
jgi:hypothetical protein